MKNIRVYAKDLTPKSTLVKTLTRDQMSMAVIRHLDNLISKAGRECVNKGYCREDIESALVIKLLSLLDNLYRKWSDIGEKTVGDIVNFISRCLVNHVTTMKHDFMKKVDLSLTVPSINSEEGEGFANTQESIKDTSNARDVHSRDLTTQMLMYTLSLGLVDEYLVLRSLVNPEQEVIDAKGNISITKTFGHHKVSMKDRAGIKQYLNQLFIRFKVKAPTESDKVELLRYGVIV